MTRLDKVIKEIKKRISLCDGQRILSKILEELPKKVSYKFVCGYATPEEFEALFGFVDEETKEKYEDLPYEDKAFLWSVHWDLEDPDRETNDEEDVSDFFVMTYYYYEKETDIEFDSDSIGIESFK